MSLIVALNSKLNNTALGFCWAKSTYRSQKYPTLVSTRGGPRRLCTILPLFFPENRHRRPSNTRPSPPAVSQHAGAVLICDGGNVGPADCAGVIQFKGAFAAAAERLCEYSEAPYLPRSRRRYNRLHAG